MSAAVHQLHGPTGNATVGAILQLGSKGPAVAELQAKLNLLQYGPIPIDQMFGQPTKDALIAFQKAEGLPTSGTLDPMTENRLNQRVLMVSTGARAGTSVPNAPLAPPVQPRRPLWQTGLMVLGGIAIAGGVLWYFLSEGEKRGYKRALPEGREPREITGRYDARGTRVAGVAREKCKPPSNEAFEQGTEVTA